MLTIAFNSQGTISKTLVYINLLTLKNEAKNFKFLTKIIQCNWHP